MIDFSTLKIEELAGPISYYSLSVIFIGAFATAAMMIYFKTKNASQGMKSINVILTISIIIAAATAIFGICFRDDVLRYKVGVALDIPKESIEKIKESENIKYLNKRYYFVKIYDDDAFEIVNSESKKIISDDVQKLLKENNAEVKE